MGKSGGEDTHWNRLRCEATHQTPTHQGRTGAWGWERLAALLKKAKEDTHKKQTKNIKIRLTKVAKISNLTRTLLGNFVALLPPPPEPPPPHPPP